MRWKRKTAGGASVRQSAKLSIMCCFPHPQKEPLSGVIVDMSEHGICIFTTEKLTEGQKIMLRNGVSQSEKTAVVRWGEKYQDLYYRIGLEFEEP